ncbi:unnamed protein product [Clonostachys byssicola]|uniref:Uncharacterized protein n=1 Tax=Clonostachys byssicola TaxID=160290 RepID=A0A9N9UKI8_9HYPO|nr:unnamed protein product [Clonostachys byssicola]
MLSMIWQILLLALGLSSVLAQERTSFVSWAWFYSHALGNHMDRDHAFIYSRTVGFITLNFLPICEQQPRPAKPPRSFLFYHILQLRVPGPDSKHPYRFVGDPISNGSFLLNHVVKPHVDGSEHSRKFFNEYVPNRVFSKRGINCHYFFTKLKLLLGPLNQAYLPEYISTWHAKFYRVQSYHERLQFQFEFWLHKLSKLTNRLDLQDISNIGCFSNRKPLYNGDNLRHANRAHDWSNFYYSIHVYRKLGLHSADGSHNRSEFKHNNSVYNRVDLHYARRLFRRFDFRRFNFKYADRTNDWPGFHYTRWFDSRPEFKYTNSAYDGSHIHSTSFLFTKLDY